MVKIIISGYRDYIGTLKIEKEDVLLSENQGDKGFLLKIKDGKEFAKNLSTEKVAYITFEDDATFEYFIEKLRYDFLKCKKPLKERVNEMRLRVLELDKAMEEKIQGYKEEKDYD
jgi:hypothetical protein